MLFVSPAHLFPARVRYAQHPLHISVERLLQRSYAVRNPWKGAQQSNHGAFAYALKYLEEVALESVYQRQAPPAEVALVGYDSGRSVQIVNTVRLSVLWKGPGQYSGTTSLRKSRRSLMRRLGAS